MKKFFKSVLQLFESPKQPTHAAASVPAIKHQIPQRIRSHPVVVKRIPLPYWQERGWCNDGSNYNGHFQTLFGRWPGYATVSPSGRVEIYIQNPPAVLSKHAHWPCFRKQKGGWFFVHPVHKVPDVSAGILGVEKTITEAHEQE